MKVAAIIPARYSSTRFPGKVLAPIAGKPMIQRVYERTSLARDIDHVLVATDDVRVAEFVKSFGGRTVMTGAEHESGTERVAEAASKIDVDVIVNVQGDEPIIAPESLDLVVRPFAGDDVVAMSSLRRPIEDHDDYTNPNVVKVVCDDQDNAIYFSRSPLPHYREGGDLLDRWRETGERPAELSPAPMKHIGVYAYRSEFLQALAHFPPAELERAERLEQLRVLAWGFSIRMVTTPHDAVSVDVPEDLEKVEAAIRAAGIE